MIVDIIVAAVVLISAMISFLRGFIREILTIAGVIAGVLAAIAFGAKLAPIFYKWFGVNDDPENIKKLFDIVPMNIVADVTAYATIFIIIVIIVSVISHFTAGAAKAMGLGPIDRTLGVIFGIIRAVLLLSLVYLPVYLYMSPETKTEYFDGSKTHYYIEKTSAYIAKFLPESNDVKEKLNEKKQETIKEKLFKNDFLKDKTAPAADIIKKEDEPAKSDETGYKEQERDKLENLFEKPTLNE